jgi:2-phosphosulfolactate phosphatase
LTQPSPRTGPKVHVLFRKEDLDDLRVEGKVIVVLDILFATSTIVAALAHGANDIIPTMDVWSASALAAEMPEGSFVASGEQYADNRLVRPNALYEGADNRQYTLIDQRS